MTTKKRGRPPSSGRGPGAAHAYVRLSKDEMTQIRKAIEIERAKISSEATLTPSGFLRSHGLSAARKIIDDAGK